MQLEYPLSAAARKFPDGVACRFDGKQFTFAQLESLVSAWVQRLDQHSIKGGDRVALLTPNSISTITTILALIRLGASAVPLNYRLVPADWKKLLQRAECRLLCTTPEFAEFTDELEVPIVTLYDVGLDNLGESRTREFSGSPLHPDANREATVIFTSGSSGESKGVILTYGNHYFSAVGSNMNIKLLPGDCWLLCLPLCHVGGLSIIFRTLLAGAAFEVTSTFDASEVNNLIDNGRITHLSLVPTMLTKLIEIRKSRPVPDTLKTILLGGAAASEELLRQVAELRLPVLTSYGMTEAASQICALSPEDSLGRLKTSGRPLRHRRLTILNDEGETVPPGQVGEIAVGGEVLSPGYLDPNGGTEPLTESGWFCTGDLGCLDQDGYLVVKGRKDDLIISGGENIYPQEILSAALGFPGIDDCAVVRVADDVWGQRPVLFVETRAEFNLQAMRDFLAEKLAGFRLPKRIIRLAKLPRTAIGKIDKELLGRFAEGASSDQES